MGILIPYYVFVLLVFTLLALVVVRFEQRVERQRKRAKNKLLTYLNIGEGTYEHSHNDLWDSTGVIEDSLLAHARAKALRGMYLAHRLRTTGAITDTKRDEAFQFFQRFMEERSAKKAVPERLPDLEIDTGRSDPDAQWAAWQWQKLAEDFVELRATLEWFATAFDRDRVDLGG